MNENPSISSLKKNGKSILIDWSDGEQSKFNFLWFCFSLLFLGVVGSSIYFRLYSVFYGPYSFFYEYFVSTSTHSQTMMLFFKLFLDSFPFLYLSLLKASRLGHWSRSWIVSPESDLVIEGLP